MDREALRRARDDAGTFAELLIGAPLWPHQLEVARSPARIRALCSGRQAGKSRTLAVLALWEAFRAPGRFVLVLSAGDNAAKDLLADCAGMATSSPLLAGSVLDENSRELLLSNGSSIRSVPASQRQVRGKSVDVLILDEAAFVDHDVWTAAQYTVIARPDSRVLLASTPWGRADRFFAVAYRAGQRGEPGFESFHWPSTVSPMVDADLLALWRRTSTDREYRREVLAEWVEDAGAYFTAAELEGSIVDSVLLDPDAARSCPVVAGVDWGFADANALALITMDERLARERGLDQAVRVVPWVEEHYGMPYVAFIERVVDVGDTWRDRFEYSAVVSEQNGVGAMPTEALARRLGERNVGGHVVGVHTDARLKENAFGQLKLWAQQGLLALPRLPALLGQLAALEYEMTDAGATKISVPERAGHDDLAMALALATHHHVETTGRWFAMPAANRHPAQGGITDDLLDVHF